MQPTTWTAPPTNDTPSGCVHPILFTLACTWVVLVTVVMQGAAWLYDQVQLAQGVPQPIWFWLAVAISQALLLALPVLPLALATRAPRYRAAYQTWLAAILFGLLLSLARLGPVTWTQPAALIQIVLSILAIVILEIVRRQRASAPFSMFNLQCSILAVALALAMLVILPWLRYGALGSPLDTFLNLLVALGLGCFTGLLLDGFLLAPLTAHSTGVQRDIGFGGLAAGIALLVLGAGFGYGGSQIPLMICLLPLGGAAIALGRFARPGQSVWLPIAGLVGLVAAAPLLLLDPDEFALIVSQLTVETMFEIAGYSLLIAFVIGIVLWLRSPHIAGAPRRNLALGALAVTGVGGLLVYFLAGLPGFYGEQIFVVLRDQPDVSAAAKMTDRTERLRYVYTTLTQNATRSQANLRATLDRLGVEYHPYYLVNGIEVNAGPLLRAYLASQPEVDRILDSPHLRPTIDAEPTLAGDPRASTSPEWNITAIGADRVWRELGVTGTGIVVGESDSGVQGDHPALRDSYRGRGGQDDYNWLDPWNNSRAPVDVGGHGTHTTGTIVGAGGIGVAPGAQWIGCVNLARNLGNPPYYLNCMQFMLAPYPQSGDPFKDGDPSRAAHVLNNSWGCPPLEGCDAASMQPAVSALRAAGIFVVASAGNSGPDCSSVSDPIAIYDDSFSVGAIDQGGNIADFSSRGPVTVDGSQRVKPDIVAPGVAVLSSLPGNSYGLESGTSMAGPHVAGVVALMWSAQPKLIGDIDRTEQLLISTTRPYSGARIGCFAGGVPSDATGYGEVDAYAAVKAALAEP